MDTLTDMKRALDYIEEHLDDHIEYAEVAKAACCSQYHFQRMFSFLTGIPLSEYIRRRRLTLAAFDLQNTDDLVITIADRYGYRSPDSFTKAFQALHQITPKAAREQGVKLKAYPRITFSLSLKGAKEMNYRIEVKKEFRIVGIRERMAQAVLGEEVGRMWADCSSEVMNLLAGLSNDSRSKTPYGLYDKMYEDNTTDYYIGVPTDQACPDGMVELQIPENTWAVFEVVGALPDAIGEMFQRIYTEWFPSSGYEHAELAEVEWYSPGDMAATDYYSEIWIPVKKK